MLKAWGGGEVGDRGAGEGQWVKRGEKVKKKYPIASTSIDY